MFYRRSERDFWSRAPDGVRKPDHVKKNIGLVLQTRCDIDDGIRDHQRFVISGQIEPENVAYAPCGAHVGIARNNRTQQFVGMLRTFHQGSGFPGVNQRDRSARCGDRIIFGIDQPQSIETDFQGVGACLYTLPRADKHRIDDAILTRGECRGQRIL